jgi:hypothetical protein
VVSLWEMLEFYAEVVVKFLSELGALERMAMDEGRDTPARPEIVMAICAKVGILQAMAAQYSLNSSDQQCQRIIRSCEASGMRLSCGEIRDDLRELRRRFEDDFKGELFLKLTSQEANQYREPMKGWEEILGRFPEAIRDVEEMQRCLSLNRYPASVFHSMQVVEHGLIYLGKWLGINDHKPGWNATTRELTRICRLEAKNRDDWETRNFGFIGQMDAVSHSLMTSWRHKIDHASGRLILLPGDFAPEIAEEIISATRGFMRRLATELPMNDPRS